MSADDSRPSADTAIRLAILAAAAVGIAVGWRTLAGGFLSDDFLINALARRDGDLAVRWSRVLADFGGPWLGLEASFYRPMLSVSLAVDLTVGGGAPWSFHLTNVVLHAAVAAMTAFLCARLARRRPGWAGLLGGVFVALHPLAVEPLAWIAARNSGLEVFFRMAALCAFAVWLRRRRRGAAVLTAALAACALASKESAVLLPVSMLGVEVLDRPRRAWSERLAIHARFAPLWIGYLALRVALFGGVVGAGATAAGDAGSVLGNAAHKLLVLIAPHGPQLDGAGAWHPPLVWTTAAAWVLATALAAASARRGAAAIACAGVWLALHAAPTFRIALNDNLSGARMLYGALPVLALLATAGATGAPRPALRQAALAALVAHTLALAPLAHSLLDRYVEAWRETRAALAGLAELAPAAAPDRPLALGAMPQSPPGVPPFNPNTWFAAAERPHQPGDVPVVSLGFLTVPVPLAESLLHDASAVRALWHADATIAVWDRNARRFLARSRAGTPPPRPPELAVAPDNEITFAAPLSGDGIEAVVLGLDRPVAACTLVLRTAAPLTPELAEVRVGADGDAPRVRFWVDLSHSMTLTSLAALGVPVDGLDVRCDAQVVEAQVLPRVPELRTARRLEGAAVALTELGASLPRLAIAPPANARARAVLLAPHTALELPIGADGVPVLPAVIERDLEVVLRFSRQRRLWFFFEHLSPPGERGAGRSALDWLTVR